MSSRLAIQVSDFLGISWNTKNQLLTLIRYMATYPNSQIVASHGAIHGSEIGLVWETMENIANAIGIKSTSDHNALSKVIRHAWATFAKDPQNGLTKLVWPKYDPSQKTLIRFGYQNARKADLATGNEYDKRCPANRLL
jgi:cholinesterase